MQTASRGTPASELDDAGDVFAHIMDPERRGELYPYYHRLREIDPIHPTREFRNMERTWFFTAHADIDTVLRNLDFVSDERTVKMFDAGPSGRLFTEMMHRMLLWLPPAEHFRIRNLVTRAFTPRQVDERRPEIQRTVDRMLDELEPRGGCEFVADFAFPLPIVTICTLLGAPAEDVPLFHEWTEDFTRRGEVGNLTEEEIARGEVATLGFTDYFQKLIDDRRARPRDDLMSALISVEDEQGRLRDDEIIATSIILLQAGHGTTQDQLGNGIIALLGQRDQYELLREQPQRIRDAVEELIRFDTSVQISQRVGPTDLEIGGVTIPRGEVCALVNGAANRDPARYPDPDRLDITREHNDHLSFGLGGYVCLGKALARSELQIALSAITKRFPDLEVASDDLPRKPSIMLWGRQSLPLRW